LILYKALPQQDLHIFLSPFTHKISNAWLYAYDASVTQTPEVRTGAMLMLLTEGIKM